MKRVFLGGTCNGSLWRNQLVPLLTIDSFNPVVDNWDEAAAAEEILQREICDFCLYVITPKMTGVYSIAEVVEDAIRRPQKTIFVYLPQDDGAEFTVHQLKSLKAVARMVERYEAICCPDLQSVADYLNTFA